MFTLILHELTKEEVLEIAENHGGGTMYWSNKDGTAVDPKHYNGAMFSYPKQRSCCITPMED